MSPRKLGKQLLCPGCGDVLATAVHTRWPGNLELTAPDGTRLQPESAAVQLRRAEPQRVEFLRRQLDELVYDLRCRRGHSTLRTMPQIVRAMRSTPGAWVPLDG